MRDVAECRYLTLTVLDAWSGQPLDSVAVTASLRSGYAETHPTLGGHLSLCLDAGQVYTIRTERAGFLPKQLDFSTGTLAGNRSG